MKRQILLLLSTAFLTAAAAAPQAETDVLAAMNAWKQATLAKDRAALDRLLHKDLSFTHSSGETWTKAQLVDYDVSAGYQPHVIEFSQISVRIYGNTALVKCIVDLKSTVNGKDGSAHHSVLHVWLKGPQGWQLVARQATKLAP